MQLRVRVGDFDEAQEIELLKADLREHVTGFDSARILSVTVTRDGEQIFLYTHSLVDAQEAERTVRELAREDNVSADISVTQWNSAAEEWAFVEGDQPEAAKKDNLAVGTPDPAYVMLEAYKPEFLRDLGF